MSILSLCLAAILNVPVFEIQYSPVLKKKTKEHCLFILLLFPSLFRLTKTRNVLELQHFVPYIRNTLIPSHSLSFDEIRSYQNRSDHVYQIISDQIRPDYAGHNTKRDQTPKTDLETKLPFNGAWGKKRRPDTRLPKSRAGGQGPYLRSPDHFGRSSEVKEIKS